MPIYDFECEACGKVVEAICGEPLCVGDPPDVELGQCPDCCAGSWKRTGVPLVASMSLKWGEQCRGAEGGVRYLTSK